jgi:hypothetical protein
VHRVTEPIACALSAGDARDQVGEWHRVLTEDVACATRRGPTRVELELVPGCDLVAVVGLAQREVTCCPFFSFDLQVLSDRLVLVVECPEGASPMLEGLLGGTVTARDAG